MTSQVDQNEPAVDIETGEKTVRSQLAKRRGSIDFERLRREVSDPGVTDVARRISRELTDSEAEAVETDNQDLVPARDGGAFNSALATARAKNAAAYLDD